MGILGWLRSLVADFLNAVHDGDDARGEEARGELEQLRSLAMLATAEARRTELELKDAMAAGPDAARLADLVPRLEEQRARARDLLERYRTRDQEETRRLQRAGEARLAGEVNARRRDLRRAIDAASAASREEELARMEDEARAEAFRLDVLDRLDAGEPVRDEVSDAREADLEQRARTLLEEPGLSVDER